MDKYLQVVDANQYPLFRLFCRNLIKEELYQCYPDDISILYRNLNQILIKNQELAFLSPKYLFTETKKWFQDLNSNQNIEKIIVSFNKYFPYTYLINYSLIFDVKELENIIDLILESPELDLFKKYSDISTNNESKMIFELLYDLIFRYYNFNKMKPETYNNRKNLISSIENKQLTKIFLKITQKMLENQDHYSKILEINGSNHINLLLLNIYSEYINYQIINDEIFKDQYWSHDRDFNIKILKHLDHQNVSTFTILSNLFSFTNFKEKSRIIDLILDFETWLDFKEPNQFSPNLVENFLKVSSKSLRDKFIKILFEKELFNNIPFFKDFSNFNPIINRLNFNNNTFLNYFLNLLKKILSKSIDKINYKIKYQKDYTHLCSTSSNYNKYVRYNIIGHNIIENQILVETTLIGYFLEKKNTIVSNFILDYYQLNNDNSLDLTQIIYREYDSQENYQVKTLFQLLLENGNQELVIKAYNQIPIIKMDSNGYFYLKLAFENKYSEMIVKLWADFPELLILSKNKESFDILNLLTKTDIDQNLVLELLKSNIKLLEYPLKFNSKNLLELGNLFDIVLNLYIENSLKDSNYQKYLKNYQTIIEFYLDNNLEFNIKESNNFLSKLLDDNYFNSRYDCYFKILDYLIYLEDLDQKVESLYNYSCFNQDKKDQYYDLIFSQILTHPKTFSLLTPIHLGIINKLNQKKKFLNDSNTNILESLVKISDPLKNSENVCMICYQTINKKYIVYPCRHGIFHDQCLKNIIDLKCPVCRQEMVSIQEIFIATF